MTDYDYDEKRDFSRMSIETQITYKIQGSDGQSHSGISGDLSATGLYMETDFSPEEGDKIELVMNPNGDRLPPFVAEGNVIRVTVSEKDANKFHVSVQLTKTS